MEAEAFTHDLRRDLDGWNRLLVVISIASSVIYFFTLSLQPYPGSIVLKGLSVSTLALVVFRLIGSRDGLILAVSLLFSSIGDVLLEIPGDKMFLFGLVSFLIAHLLYIVLFARNFPRPLKSGSTEKLIIVAVPIYSIIMTAWLWPGLGDLSGPVIFYICAITAMVLSAALAGFASRLIFVGALLFFISDSLIAINRFKFPIKYSDYLIWSTYYAAQFLITLGFLREKLNRQPRVFI